MKEHETVHFKCHFNTSLIPDLAICGWLKDGHNASNGKKWNDTEPGFKNHLICGFDIINVSMADAGKYSCYCYYSEAFRQQFHYDHVVSHFGKAVLQFETSKMIILTSTYLFHAVLSVTEGKHHFFSVRNIGPFIAFFIILAAFILFFCFWYFKKKKGDLICMTSCYIYLLTSYSYIDTADNDENT